MNILLHRLGRLTSREDRVVFYPAGTGYLQDALEVYGHPDRHNHHALAAIQEFERDHALPFEMSGGVPSSGPFEGFRRARAGFLVAVRVTNRPQVSIHALDMLTGRQSFVWLSWLHRRGWDPVTGMINCSFEPHLRRLRLREDLDFDDVVEFAGRSGIHDIFSDQIRLLFPDLYMMDVNLHVSVYRAQTTR